MGTCMGRCFRISNTKRKYHTQKTTFRTREENVEFDFLVDEEQAENESSKWPSCISYILTLRRKKPSKDLILELTDDSWPTRSGNGLSHRDTNNCPSSDMDVPLQSLDVRSLVANKAVHQVSKRERSITSTPPSSLDLEWEHEDCLPMHATHYAEVVEEDVCDSSATNGKTCASSAGWSRISTPDSLEWDPVEASLASMGEECQRDLDTETEMLLSEIERLTSRALRETGDWSS